MYYLDTIPFPFPYKEIIISENLFMAPSAMHGVGHTYRVMLLSAILAHALGWEEHCKEAIWAAALHDMQRMTDEEDINHGHRAVTITLPLFVNIMKKEGIADDGIRSISFSIEQHCIDIELKQTLPYYKTAAILKEADMLDRVRFNGLDTSYLRFENKIGTISISHSLFNQLLLHLVATKGESYSSIAYYTTFWLRNGDCTHTQYINNCKAMFGDHLTDNFFSIINNPFFYCSFLESHAIYTR